MVVLTYMCHYYENLIFFPSSKGWVRQARGDGVQGEEGERGSPQRAEETGRRKESPRREGREAAPEKLDSARRTHPGAETDHQRWRPGEEDIYIWGGILGDQRGNWSIWPSGKDWLKSSQLLFQWWGGHENLSKLLFQSWGWYESHHNYFSSHGMGRRVITTTFPVIGWVRKYSQLLFQSWGWHERVKIFLRSFGRPIRFGRWDQNWKISWYGYNLDIRLI